MPISPHMDFSLGLRSRTGYTTPVPQTWAIIKAPPKQVNDRSSNFEGEFENERFELVGAVWDSGLSGSPMKPYQSVSESCLSRVEFKDAQQGSRQGEADNAEFLHRTTKRGNALGSAEQASS
ncbi:hypothetical protein C8J57DRAFT_1220344 [Mycena rebaudengoi]|nr:hypothetical protein C8J57DRAFT_1220344 [Mycena rebaudengoi]